MSGPGFIVPPRKKQDIYDLAADLRKRCLRITGGGEYVPIDKIYELMPDLLPGFVMEIRDHEVMGENHGRAYPATRRIELRQDVYDGMCEGKGRDRFTGAHEFGHLFLHANVAFARAITPGLSIKLYCDSEWQANTFASGFLIDRDALETCRSVQEVAHRFGVSEDAARVRFKR